jgi:DNA-3-methyladenine glycosylase I
LVHSLEKRENYRIAFDDYDPVRVVIFDDAKIQSLMLNSGIIRNNQKIRSTINNAQQFLKIQEEFSSFSNYIWRFVEGKPIINIRKEITDYHSSSKESDALARI